jgi:transposase InsO family protein
MGKEVPMPWRETRVMDERMAFVVDVQRGEASLAELCRRYGISRKSGYKWLARHAAEGLDGLKDRSRAPHHHPQALEPDVAAAALAVRAKHPTWGPKKIRAWLGQHRGDLGIPAQSTIGVLLERHGLVQPRRPHRRVPLHPGPLRACERPNAVWGVDFKGWFVLGNGRRCDPLSLSDLASRYVLRLQVVERPDGAHVWPLLEAAFREFGLPEVIRSDNGPPFASTGVGGLSRLAVTLIKAGVTPERIAPGKPQQNGRHERLHRTVQEETARPPAFEARAQQRRFDAFRHRFNEERPHEALGLTPPAQHYHASPRAYHGRLRSPDYGSDQEVRRVRQNGEIKWRGALIFLSEALIGEPVGVAESETDGTWSVRYGPVELGRIGPAGHFIKAGAHSRPKPQPLPPG